MSEGEKQTVSFEELQPGMKLKNLACQWTVIGLPRYHFMHPQHGNVMKVRAMCEFLNGMHPKKEVDLQGYEYDEMEVTL